jgi:hypothetical protein
MARVLFSCYKRTPEVLFVRGPEPRGIKVSRRPAVGQPRMPKADGKTDKEEKAA